MAKFHRNLSNIHKVMMLFDNSLLALIGSKGIIKVSNDIRNDIQSYSVLDFPSTKLPLNSKGGTRVGNLQHVRHVESFR